MKKIITLFMSAVMLSSITSCSNVKISFEDDDNDANINSEVTQESKAIKETTTQGFVSEGASLDYTYDENQQETQSEMDIIDDTIDTIEGRETSKNNPAELGQWVSSLERSDVDQTYHEVFIRITKFTTESDDPKYVNEAIELSNEYRGEYSTIEDRRENLSDDEEICIVDYEVYIPTNFPVDESGYINSSPYCLLGVINNNDKGGTYSWSSHLETENEHEYEAGKTYEFRSMSSRKICDTDIVISSEIIYNSNGDAFDIFFSPF